MRNEIFGKYLVSAVCRYNLNTFSAEMIKHIIDIHPIIIWEGQIHHNPFYFDTIDLNDVDVFDYQVAAMLNIITSFTNTKSRFYNELQEKEAFAELIRCSATQFDAKIVDVFINEIAQL